MARERQVRQSRCVQEAGPIGPCLRIVLELDVRGPLKERTAKVGPRALGVAEQWCEGDRERLRAVRGQDGIQVRVGYPAGQMVEIRAKREDTERAAMTDGFGEAEISHKRCMMRRGRTFERIDEEVCGPLFP